MTNVWFTWQPRISDAGPLLIDRVHPRLGTGLCHTLAPAELIAIKVRRATIRLYVCLARRNATLSGDAGVSTGHANWIGTEP